MGILKMSFKNVGVKHELLCLLYFNYSSIKNNKTLDAVRCICDITFFF